MKKLTLIAFLFIGVLLATSFLSPVTAQDSDGDSIDDSVEDDHIRTILPTNVSTTEVEVESEFDNGTVENEFTVRVRTDDGIRIKIEYSTEINATEKELEFSIQFKELIEYTDTNGNGVYDNGEELFTLELDTLTVATPNATPITSTDGEAGVEVAALITNQSFQFLVTGVVFPKYASFDNLTLTPTEMKITIAINDYPFTQSDTHLALVVELETELEIETDTSETEVHVQTNTTRGFFTWSNETLVDGAVKLVNTTMELSGNDTRVYFNYVQGAQIIHDPTLGLQIGVSTPTTTPTDGTTPPPLPIDPILILAPILAIVVIVIVIVAVRRRTP